MQLESLLNFTRLLHKFREVTRVVRHRGLDSFENDAEHSFQLAVLAIYIIDAEKLVLNISKVLLFALLHDLPEVHTGDVAAHDYVARIGKEEREQESIKQILQEFPEFTTFSCIIEEYEELTSPEAKFVYALDKIIPAINVTENNGREWKELSIGLEEFITMKEGKADIDPTIANYWVSLKQLIISNKSEWF
jgi:putative hydrolases of HD superfamily